MRIVEVAFVNNHGHVTVMAELEDGSLEDVVSYYIDELRFSREDFIGKTPEQASALHRQRDIAYLQSDLPPAERRSPDPAEVMRDPVKFFRDPRMVDTLRRYVSFRRR